MKRRGWLLWCFCVPCALALCFSAVRAQDVNSWTNTFSGDWLNGTNWSQGVHPTGSDAVYITNSNNKIVSMIGPSSANPPDMLAADSVTVSAPACCTNTFIVANVNGPVPFHAYAGATISTGGALMVKP